jgi:hypothetical protein
LAKRKKPSEQSLFDNIDADGGSEAGRDAAIRSSLLSGSRTATRRCTKRS